MDFLIWGVGGLVVGLALLAALRPWPPSPPPLGAVPSLPPPLFSRPRQVDGRVVSVASPFLLPGLAADGVPGPSSQGGLNDFPRETAPAG